MKHCEYALYKGDTFIDIGTIKELANRLGVKESTIMYYNAPSYKNKRFKGNQYIIKLGKEEI